MMDERTFVSWAERLGLATATVDLIRRIRSSPPSRRVASGRGNVSGRYPSKKMGGAIQFESHTVELSAIYTMEHDQEILEFYDQPSPFKLRYRSAGGHPLGPLHTPDFFVLAREWGGWDEWKTEEHLEKLSKKAPNRYVRDGEHWRCPPGEAVAATLGLRYRLRSDAELNPVTIRNLRFLEDYLVDPDPVAPDLVRLLRDLVKQKPSITVRELIFAAEHARTIGEG